MKNKSHLDWIDVWVILALVLIGTVGWNTRVDAGFYVDAGIGMIRGLEYQASASIDLGNGLELKYTGEVKTLVDTGFFMFRGGYETNGWHLELQTTGIPDYHYETFTIYHRWELF